MVLESRGVISVVVVVTRGVIEVMMMADVDICLKRTDTLPIVI